MIARQYRLQRSDQFRRVRRDGRSFSGELVSLVVAPGRRRRLRLGFVVGKKVGGAVVRNRCRRRLREAVRLLIGHIVEGHDLVFHIRAADLTEMPFDRLQQAVELLLRRAHVWRDQLLPQTTPAGGPAEVDA